MNKIAEKLNIFGDDIAKLEKYDFSRANISKESRILGVTTVASICYGNPKGIGKVSLYDRLACESMGLPSSSFEFVPVLIDYDRALLLAFDYPNINSMTDMSIFKFGTQVGDKPHGGPEYILTNLRALIDDVGERADEFFNTPEECDIIKQHFRVYRAKLDLPTRSQMVRHRSTYQELSRRYVSDNRQPFQFYISEDMKDINQEVGDELVGTQDLINMCVDHYCLAVKSGVKPQNARRIIPQAAYTDIWIAMQPYQYDNFTAQRTDKHAQWEIRQLAIAMKELEDV